MSEPGRPRVLGASVVPEANGPRALPVIRRGLAWWLWPHVLSLDAPMVAVVWQHWWARATGAHVLWFQDVILGGGVWMIYLADRLADTWPTGLERWKTARHMFSWRHRRALQPLLAGVVSVLTILTLVKLPGRQFAAGAGLLLVAGGYFWLIHRGRPSPWARFVPKEAIVGVIFAAGTVFFVPWQGEDFRRQVLGGVLLFAVLCFVNCALITQWEATAEDLGEQTSLLHAFRWLDGRLGAGCLGLAVLCGLLSAGTGSVLFLPVAVAALGLAWLDYRSVRFSADALRVLADLALLAPLLWSGWPRK